MLQHFCKSPRKSTAQRTDQLLGKGWHCRKLQQSILKVNGLVSEYTQAARAATGALSFNHGALSGLEGVPVAHVQHADRLSFTDWQLWLCFCNGTAKLIINVIALMFWARTSIV